jgi:hypothetical protein
MLLVPSISGLFKWRQFEPEVVLLAVGWYLRFSLSYRRSRSCSPSAVCGSTMSPSGVGSSATPRSCSGVYAGTLSRRAIVGASTKPTYGSKASGATCIGRWTPLARPWTFSSRPSRTRLQQSASWPKPWVNRTIPRRVSSTPMDMRLTRPRSLSSRVKERWTPAASTGRCRTSIMSWSRTIGPSSGGLTPARASVLFGLPGVHCPATR